MGLFKRGNYWCFDFWYKRKRFQGSTRIRNHEAAKLWLNKFKINLAMTGVGLVQKEPPPILATFLKGAFLDSVRQNAKKPRTKLFYEGCVKRLCLYAPFTTLRLDQIDEIAVGGYREFRLRRNAVVATFVAEQQPPSLAVKAPIVTTKAPKSLSISTINGELRTLRKCLRFADECGLVRYRRVRTLPGERNRTFVLTGEMELAFLAAATYPLKQVAILMLDLGLRPEEAVSLRKSDVMSGAVTITHGKTTNARRTLPQTERTREVFKLCAELFPESEWVFPGSKGRHFHPKSLSNIFTALRIKHQWPTEFKLYSCRHTFGSRLAESGASVFDIKALMGHSKVSVSERYIHPSSEHTVMAMKRLEAMGKILRGEVVHEEASEKPRTS